MDVHFSCWALDLQPFADEVERKDTCFGNDGTKSARDRVGGAVRRVDGRRGAVGKSAEEDAGRLVSAEKDSPVVYESGKEQAPRDKGWAVRFRFFSFGVGIFTYTVLFV